MIDGDRPTKNLFGLEFLYAVKQYTCRDAVIIVVVQDSLFDGLIICLDPTIEPFDRVSARRVRITPVEV